MRLEIACPGRTPRLSGALARIVIASFLTAGSLLAQNAAITPPQVPSPGQNHLPPNTRVIQGVVKDKDGAPVNNAVVLLKDTKTLQIRSYLTQADGTYHFFGLSDDVSYQVRAEHSGMISPSKLVSVFDSKKFINVNLKLKDKKKPYPS